MKAVVYLYRSWSVLNRKGSRRRWREIFRREGVLVHYFLLSFYHHGYLIRNDYKMLA